MSCMTHICFLTVLVSVTHSIHWNNASPYHGFTFSQHTTYFAAEVYHNSMGGFEVTKATVESSLIVAVLCFRLTDCILQIFQQRPDN